MEYPNEVRKLLKAYGLSILHQHHVVHALIDATTDVNGVSTEDALDMVHIMQQTANLLEECAKAVRKNCKRAEVVCAVKFVKDGAGERIRGQFASGEPKSRLLPRIPKMEDNPEAYMQMCKDMGIDTESPAVKFGLFTPKFTGLRDYIAHKEELGEPNPFPTYEEATEVTIRCTAKRTVNLDQIAIDTARGKKQNE